MPARPALCSRGSWRTKHSALSAGSGERQGSRHGHDCALLNRVLLCRVWLGEALCLSTDVCNLGLYWLSNSDVVSDRVHRCRDRGWPWSVIQFVDELCCRRADRVPHLRDDHDPRTIRPRSRCRHGSGRPHHQEHRDHRRIVQLDRVLIQADTMDTSPLRIGYCLSLSGALASNGKTARLAHQIWQEHVNTNGKLLGRPVELVCLDDQTNPKLVADIYQRLLDVEKVDVVIGGYGDNSVAPAMPLIVERKRFFLGLMALAVNAKFNYPQYFVMIPTGPHPHLALTEGFFQVAAQQSPRPETVAILIADAPFSQSPAQGAKDNLAREGMRVIFEGKYPLSTTDFTPYMEDLKRINPDVLFLRSSMYGVKSVVDKGYLPSKM